MKKKTVFIALTAVFSVAICFIILGAISIDLMTALNLNAGLFGTLVMSFYISCTIVQLFIGFLTDKIGYKPIAVLGFISASLSIFLLAVATTFTTALIACIIMGVGAMSLNTVGNTLIPIVLFKGKDQARASNLGNAFFGFGYVLIPLFLTLIVKILNLQYSVALIIIAALLLIFAFFVLFTVFPKPSIGYEFSKAIKLLFKPAILIAALALFCYSSLEATMGTWINKYMEELYIAKGIAAPTLKSGMVLSLFGLAMMIGRFVFSTVKDLTKKGAKVISLMSILSLFGILLMIFAKEPIVGIIAIFLIGMAFAPIFPNIVGVTYAKFDPSLYGSIFGIIYAIGMCGSTFLPKYIGDLSVGTTVQQSLPIAAIIIILLFIISLFIGRIGNNKNNDEKYIS